MGGEEGRKGKNILCQPQQPHHHVDPTHCAGTAGLQTGLTGSSSFLCEEPRSLTLSLTPTCLHRAAVKNGLFLPSSVVTLHFKSSLFLLRLDALERKTAPCATFPKPPLLLSFPSRHISDLFSLFSFPVLSATEAAHYRYAADYFNESLWD